VTSNIPKYGAFGHPAIFTLGFLELGANAMERKN